MDRYSDLFYTPSEELKIVKDGTSGQTLERTAVTEKLFDFSSKDQIKLTPNPDGLLFVPVTAQRKYPVIFTPNNEYAGNAVKLVVETAEVEGLIAYVQKLGMNRGKWRDLFEPQEMEGAGVSMPRSAAWIEYGKEVYEHRCVGCHGVKGDGNGPAATFMYKQRPRNFTQGVFKFRLTEGSLPTDGDMLRTISRGVRGTAMPPWYDLPLNDRLAVIQYIKYELAVDRTNPNKPIGFFDESPGEPLYIPPPPPPTTAMITHGKEIWVEAKCWECHGETGKGDGQKAAGLTDDPGFGIRPANLTGGQFKSGPSVTDIFRTISTGLSGTPMPSYRDAFPEPDRWALSYYILSLSAFTDPINGEPLKIAAADREALDNPKLQTPGPEQAYGLLPP
jgi:cytochrome c oxidase cbb3-type subunit 2